MSGRGTCSVLKPGDVTGLPISIPPTLVTGNTPPQTSTQGTTLYTHSPSTPPGAYIQYTSTPLAVNARRIPNAVEFALVFTVEYVVL